MDREAKKWIGVFTGTFIVSLVGGWFLPDGFNALAKLLHDPKLQVTGLIRFFSFAALFILLLAIDLMIWMRSQWTKAVARVDQAVKDAMEKHSSEMAERALVRALLPQRAATEEEAADAAGLLHKFGTVLGSVPPHLLSGYGVFIGKGIARITEDLARVTAVGIEVDVQQHLQITKRFVRNNRPFLQIQRRAYDVPGDWTNEWVHLVEELGKRKPAPEYIVLMRSAELEANADKIHGMAKHFSEAGWSFSCCELERIEDILGADLRTENVDVYGDVAAKLHPPADVAYRGRPKFNLQLVDLSRDDELRRFIEAVRSHTRSVTADWPPRRHRARAAAAPSVRTNPGSGAS